MPPREEVQLRVGDVLVRAARRELRSVAALYAAIDDAAETRRLRVVVLRGTEEQRLTLSLAGAAAAHGSLAMTAGRSAREEHRL